MKRAIFILMLVVLIALVFTQANQSLQLAGNNMYNSYLESCQKGSVKKEITTLLGIPTAVRVKGWDCVGPDSNGSEYRAQIWDHFFWTL